MSTGHNTVAVFFGWEGNRRSGIALVMRHSVCSISIHHMHAQRSKEGR